MTRNGETGFDVMFGGTMTGRMGRPEAEWRRIVAETVGRWFGTEPQIRSRGGYMEIGGYMGGMAVAWKDMASTPEGRKELEEFAGRLLCRLGLERSGSVVLRTGKTEVSVSSGPEGFGIVMEPMERGIGVGIVMGFPDGRVCVKGVGDVEFEPGDGGSGSGVMKTGPGRRIFEAMDRMSRNGYICEMDMLTDDVWYHCAGRDV